MKNTKTNVLKWQSILAIALVTVIGFSFAACDDGGGGSSGTTPTGGGGLPAPMGLSATATSSTQIVLTWNAVSGAAGYNVYQSQSSSSGFNKLGTTTTNSATNYNLPPNTTFYYKVAAYSSNGTEGDISNVVSATTSGNNGAITYSIEGVWEITDGTQITISGSTGIYKVFGGDYSSLPLFADAKNKGYIKLGDQFWRYITSTGNLTWSGQELGVTWSGNNNIATGTGWTNCTFTMSADGRALTRTASNVTVAVRKQ